MDLSLIMDVIYMQIAMHVAKTNLEGRLSQHFDICFSFGFTVCKRLGFKVTQHAA